MKKFLVILMVVAMASFLFVGCIPTTPAEEEAAEEETAEEEEVVVAATVAPVLTAVAGISLTSSATQYINAAEADDVVVTGTAPTYSEVKVYVDDVCAGTADVGVTGTFSVVVAEADLGADGDKVIYATAKEAALDVSAHSTEYAFVLDQVAPGIDSVAATAASTKGISTATLSTDTNATVTTIALSQTEYPAQTFEAGYWTVATLGNDGVANNILVTSPSGVATYYTVSSNAVVTDTMIPGVKLTFGTIVASTDILLIKVSSVVAATSTVSARATMKFNEDVSYLKATGATYTWGDGTGAFAAYKEANDTYYVTITGADFTVYSTQTFTVYGVTDLAGNVGGTSTAPLSKSCSVGLASLTALKP